MVETFAIWLCESQGLLGASLEGITVGETNPKMLNARAGAAVVVAAEAWHRDGAWMTATGSPRYEGRHGSTGLGPIVTNRLIQLSRNPYPSPLRQHMLQCSIQHRLMRIGTDIVNVEMVTDDGGRIPASYQELSYPREIQGLCGHMQQRYGNCRTHLSRHPRDLVRKSAIGRAWDEMTA